MNIWKIQIKMMKKTINWLETCQKLYMSKRKINIALRRLQNIFFLISAYFKITKVGAGYSLENRLLKYSFFHLYRKTNPTIRAETYAFQDCSKYTSNNLHNREYYKIMAKSKFVTAGNFMDGEEENEEEQLNVEDDDEDDDEVDGKKNANSSKKESGNEEIKDKEEIKK